MSFSVRQLRALRRAPDHRYIRTREAHGRELTYLEGWYAISQANRIFGFDGWSRETLDSRCVLARENRGSFTAVYTAKVRLTVQADGTTLTREGHGTGEGHGTSAGEAHDTALKAAETDATKRALATFGKPFGLELYRGHKTAQATKPAPIRHRDGAAPASANIDPQQTRRDTTSTSPAHTGESPALQPGQPNSPEPALRTGFHPDDTTPIPRPSHYYGRPRDELTEHARKERRDAERQQRLEQRSPADHLQSGSLPSGARNDLPGTARRSEPRAESAVSIPSLPLTEPAKIDKSALTIGEPKRLRDKAHLRHVASQPCLVCGRHPCDPHHLRFAQPRAIGMKVSDEFTVPLCRTHHRQLHQVGDERVWWAQHAISPLETARALWQATHPAASPHEGSSTASPATAAE
jgi:DNA recombination protein Rad52